MHVPLMKALAAQFTAFCKKSCELGQVCAAQLAMQMRSNDGVPPPPPMSRHPIEQKNASEQLERGHMPQSASQLMHVSRPLIESSQTPLPHTEQTPQSWLQLAQFSCGRSQVPLPIGTAPQPSQRPQSA